MGNEQPRNRQEEARMAGMKTKCFLRFSTVADDDYGKEARYRRFGVGSRLAASLCLPEIVSWLVMRRFGIH